MADIAKIAEEEYLNSLSPAEREAIKEVARIREEETGFGRQFQYSAASTLAGLAQQLEGLGLDFVDLDEEELLLYRDLADVASEDNPLLGFAGAITGGAVDILGGPLSAVGKGAKALTGAQGLKGSLISGASTGAATGFVEPILTEDDSRLLNIGLGTGLGAGLSGGLYGLGRALMPVRDETVLEAPEQEQLRIGMDAQPERIGREERLGIGFQDSNEGKRTPRVGTERTGLGTVEAGMERPVTPVRGAKGPVTEEPEFNPIETVKKELQEKVKGRAERKKVKQLKSEVTNLSKSLNELNNKRVKRGPQRRKIEAQKAKIVEKINAKRKELEKDAEARLAQKELTRIANNQISPVTAQRIAMLGQQRPMIAGIREAQAKMEPKAEQAEARVSPAEARVVEPERVVPEPEYPNVAGQTERIATGLEGGLMGADTVSAARVTPKGMIMPEAEAGVDQDALLRSVSASRAKANQKETTRAAQGFEREAAPQARETLRQRASRMQFEELNGGRVTQSFDEIINEAEALEARLGDEYDSLLEWAYDTWRVKERFNPAEQIVFDKLVRASDELVQSSAKKLRALKRTGDHLSDDGIRAFQDLQIAGYVLNIDKANRNQTGRALAIMRVTNERRKGIWKDYSKGKRQSTDVMLMGGC